MKKIFSALLVFFFSINYVFAASIAGKIQSITLVENGQYELSVFTDDGSSVIYMVDENTIVKQPVAAKELKKGQVVLLESMSGTEKVKGVTGFKSPFSGISPQNAKAMGIPNIPDIPNVPEVPKIPKVPEIPKIPQLPGALSQGGNQKPVSEEEVPDLPQDRSYTELNPNAVSPATPDNKPVGKKVLNLKKTNKGIELTLEDNEPVTLDPEAAVFHLLTPEDLKERMNVNLDVQDQVEGSRVQQITIV